jgi:hypothetical protein
VPFQLACAFLVNFIFFEFNGFINNYDNSINWILYIVLNFK